MSHGPVIHFFAGKGGAGKSTLATAYALNLLEANGKEKILLLSLETPGGLADLLKKKLSNKATRLLPGKGNGGLFAAEVDFEALGAEFVKFAKPQLLAAATKGQVLAEDDLKKVFEASLANSGEVGFLFNLLELSEAKEYEHVVIDGWSTTHSLRLLDHATNVRKLCALIRAERTFRPSKNAVRPATPVDELAAKADAVNAMLKDPKRFAVHVCAVSEPVGESQAKLIHRILTERGITLADIIADMIEDGKGSREVENRRGLQAPHVRKYATLVSKVDLILRRIVGPRGLEEVKKFGKEWAAGKESKSLQFSPAEAPPALVRAPSMPPMAAPPIPPTRFIFFVGSGGVGKSSCAAAAAVTLTEKEGPVLLLSVDPSHSLSDVVQSRLTDTETQVKGTKGLYARELDTAGWFAALKKRVREKSEKVFEPSGKNPEVSYDRELLRNLIDVAPAALDELPALSALAEALLQERFKRIVVDPTPTMDGMRLMDLPVIARAWLTQVIAVLTKHRVRGFGELIEELQVLLKHVARFEQALATPAESRFVVVTRGDELAQVRTERLVEIFKERKLAVERVLVNRVLPKADCPRCEARRKNELNVAKALEKKVGVHVTVAPALGRHPAGLRELKAFRTSWYALTAPAPAKTRAA